MVIDTKQIKTDRYTLINDDCITALKTMKDSCISMALFSPPFVSLYSYSDHPADMGNCKTYEEFFEHFSFLVEQLQRVLIPGRVIAVHCMDLPLYKKEGEDIGLRDFSGDLIRCFQKFGFIFHSRHCIWKDPLIAATRTKAIGLAHKQIVKDSSICRTGLPDYIVAFRKPGENPKPISHKEGFTEYHGRKSIPRELEGFTNFKGNQAKNKRSHWIWQRYASPVWDDIDQTKVLPYRKAKDGEDEKHICPLQLEVIERCIALWTAPNDVVLTPFMGVGSEVYVAVKNGRKAIGIELKRSYYKQALRNLKSLEHTQKKTRLI